MSQHHVSPDEWRKLFFAIGRLYNDDTEHFSHRVFSILQSLVGADLISFDHVDLEREVATTELSRDIGTLLPTIAEAWSRFAPEHPIVQYSATGGTRRVVRMSDLVSVRELRDRPVYTDLLRLVDTQQQIAIVPKDGKHLIGIALNRSKTKYTDRDVALLEWLCPHITRAYLHQLALAELQARRSCTPSSEVISLTPDGKCVECPASMIELLKRHFGSEAAGWETLNGFVEAGRADLSRVAVPVSSTLSTRIGALKLRLCVPSGVNGFVLIAEERASFRIAPAVRAKLTPRETEVLTWIAQGKRDGEIAIILGISPRTAERHVANILEKLGVETRTAALSMAMGGEE